MKPVVARSASQKPYHPSPVQDSKGAVPEAYCPDLRCTPQAGMGKIVAAAQCSGTLWREEEDLLVCLSGRSDLPFIGTGEGREQAATGREATEGDEANRQRPKRRAVRIQCPLQKTFQYARRAWQKLRHRLIPATRGAARRDEADSGGGARVDVPLVLMLIHVGKEPPL